MYNEEGECGTGAVVPLPADCGSSPTDRTNHEDPPDKLYEITPGLKQIIRPESTRHAGQPHDPQGVGTIEHRALFHR